ncbi:hypothetical protein ACFLU6_04030 [Acidobacteriota bacterium]
MEGSVPVPGILFFEDLTLLSPYMHTDSDVVGISLNSDELFLRNVQAAAATVFTLARPVPPEKILLYATRQPGDSEQTVRLSWTGGFPPYNVHRSVMPDNLRDDANIISEQVTALLFQDDGAIPDLLYYSIEEFP